MRKLHGRFNELDLSENQAKEKIRSGPVFDTREFDQLWASAPTNTEAVLLAEEEPDQTVGPPGPLRVGD
jgi:hypothetical protein